MPEPKPSEYCVAVQGPGSDGGGFFVTDRFAVTAAHCISGLSDGDELQLEVSSSGHRVNAIVDQIVDSHDVALLLLHSKVGRGFPDTDRAQSNDAWWAPYRPDTTATTLSGRVTISDVSYRAQGGGLIRALELRNSVSLGDYTGYSGGPVEKGRNDARGGVIGILIEQYPDRVADRRATDALFAAQIAEVLALFTALNPLNVARRLTGEEKFDSLMRARDEGRLDEESRAAARAVEKLQAQIGELYGHVQRGHFSSSRLTDILHKIGSEVGRELLEFDDD